jgi:hypothetical protein
MHYDPWTEIQNFRKYMVFPMQQNNLIFFFPFPKFYFKSEINQYPDIKLSFAYNYYNYADKISFFPSKICLFLKMLTTAMTLNNQTGNIFA